MSTQIEHRGIRSSGESQTLSNSRKNFTVNDTVITVDDSQGRTFFDKVSHSGTPDEKYTQGELVKPGDRVTLPIGFLRWLQIIRVD